MILFIQQLSAMAQHLQPPSQIGFFRSSADCGVSKVIEFGLSKKPPQQPQQKEGTEEEDPLDNSAIKSAICETLITIMDYDPHFVRNCCSKQNHHTNSKKNDSRKNLVECLVELLLIEPDLVIKHSFLKLCKFR